MSSITIKATDWETAKGEWLTKLFDFNPAEDMLWVDHQKRTFYIERGALKKAI